VVEQFKCEYSLATHDHRRFHHTEICQNYRESLDASDFNNKKFFHKLLENIMIREKIILSISLVMLSLPVTAEWTHVGTSGSEVKKIG